MDSVELDSSTKFKYKITVRECKNKAYAYVFLHMFRTGWKLLDISSRLEERCAAIFVKALIFRRYKELDSLRLGLRTAASDLYVVSTALLDAMLGLCVHIETRGHKISVKRKILQK